jgi:uncharacterized protein
MLTQDLHTRLFILQPTPFCNLDCQYCYLPDRDNKAKISLEIVEASFERLFSSNLVKDNVYIVWHCGEPLVAGLPFFKEAISILEAVAKKYSKENSYTNGIQTNALLINENWCEFFKEKKFSVGVSIDGPDFIHDRHRTTKRGIPTHQAVMKGWKLLQQYEVNTNIIGVLTDFSLDYANEIHDFFASLNVSLVGFNMDEVEGTNLKSSYSPSNHSLKRFKKFMSELYGLVESSKAFAVREFELAKNLILETQDLEHGENRPFSIISVDHQGNFSTFAPELLTIKNDQYGDFIFGNVLNNSFHSSFNTDKYQQVSQSIEKGILLCKESCDYFDMCRGGSASNKYFEQGKFQCDETTYCIFMKKAIIDVVLEKMEQFTQTHEQPQNYEVLTSCGRYRARVVFGISLEDGTPRKETKIYISDVLKENLYESIRSQVEEGNQGKLVAIDLETGDFEIGANVVDAVEIPARDRLRSRLSSRRPDGIIWSFRIGSGNEGLIKVRRFETHKVKCYSSGSSIKVDYEIDERMNTYFVEFDRYGFIYKEDYSYDCGTNERENKRILYEDVYRGTVIFSQFSCGFGEEC